MKKEYKNYYVGQIVRLMDTPDKQLREKIGRTGVIRVIDDACQIFTDFSGIALIDEVDEFVTFDTENVLVTFITDGNEIEMSLKDAFLHFSNKYKVAGYAKDGMPDFKGYTITKKEKDKIVYERNSN